MTGAPRGWMSCRLARTQATRRIDAQRAELDASSKHTARMEREAQAEAEADRQAETPNDMGMEP
jgi:hypothetical protein